MSKRLARIANAELRVTPVRAETTGPAPTSPVKVQTPLVRCSAIPAPIHMAPAAPITTSWLISWWKTAKRRRKIEPRPRESLDPPRRLQIPDGLRKLALANPFQLAVSNFVVRSPEGRLGTQLKKRLGRSLKRTRRIRPQKEVAASIMIVRARSRIQPDHPHNGRTEVRKRRTMFGASNHHSRGERGLGVG